MEYIDASSVSTSDPGGEAELTAWSSLRTCFDTNEQGILYHQYPIIEKGGNRFDRKPDFVLLHGQYGLVILECKAFSIDDIEEIQGEKWIIQGSTRRTPTPLQQARDQGYHLTSYFQREPELRDDRGRTIPMTPVVVLPNIDRYEWERRGFDGPSAPRVITSDELGEVTLRDRLDSVLPDAELTNKEYNTAKDVLSCGQAISGPPGEPSNDPTTRGEYYEQVTKGIVGLDNKQQKIGLQTPPGPQQVRGIAGSGKTVLIAMKAARMLSEPEEWSNNEPEETRIALTFKTKSLYQVLTNLVERFYEQFTDHTPDEAVADLDIIHGWGGAKTGEGVYYRLAKQIPNVRFKPYNVAKREYPDAQDKQEPLSEEVLNTGDIPQIWDAILVDEAQDFGPKFLNMCREATTDQNRLIWGYDEAQDLTSLTAPSPTNIFGTDDDGNPQLDLSGQYRGGPQKTFIMRKSYRTPRPLLMLAHALGMGLKRSGGPVQAITRQDGWENIGYEVDGDFRKIGSEAILRRPVDNSPHPLQDELSASDFITHESFESKLDEVGWVSKKISDDIKKEELRPDKILVLPLSKSKRSGKKNMDFVADKLAENLEPEGIEINRVWKESDKKFEKDGEVTVSGIRRAKGNEAASVYVLGLDSVTEEGWRNKPEVHRRNQLFVALTRSRAWVSLTGTNPTNSIHSEVNKIVEEIRPLSPEVTFEVPKKDDLTNELESDTKDINNTKLDDYL